MFVRVVGHSYCVYGPLLSGGTSIFVEGKPVGTPDHHAWFRLIERYGVNVLFCAPTAVRALRKAASGNAREFDEHNLSSLGTWFVAGEKADGPTIHWLQKVLGPTVDVADHWWQTESGSPMCSAYFAEYGGPVPPQEGSVGLPVAGWDISVDDAGAVVAQLPLPPGASTQLLWDEDGAQFRAKYVSGNLYLTGDAGVAHSDGQICITARTDDVLKVAGHRITTGQIEEAVMHHPCVAECAVVAQQDPVKGEVPVVWVVPHESTGELLEPEVKALVRDKVGAIATPARVLLLPKLPRTRSGKAMRSLLRDALHKSDLPTPPTIEDASIVAVIREVVAGRT